MPISDNETTIRDLKSLVFQFTRERNWEQFHNPKDLGLCLMIEAGEALEHFRFRSDGQIRDRLADPECHREFSYELADCLWALLRLADVSGVDLAATLEKKLALAAQKYPVEQAFGRNDKYTEYSGQALDGDPS